MTQTLRENLDQIPEGRAEERVEDNGSFGAVGTPGGSGSSSGSSSSSEAVTASEPDTVTTVGGEEVGTFPVAAQVESSLLEPAEAEHILKIQAAERAARNGVEVARDALNHTLDAAQETISGAAVKAAEAADRLRFKARELSYASREQYGELKERTSHLYEEADGYVRSNPLRAAGITAGLGLLLGLTLFGRGGSRRAATSARKSRKKTTSKEA